MLAEYQLTESTRLMIANVHSTLVRSLGRALIEIEKLLDQTTRHDGPLIVAGDFNTFQGRYFQQLETLMAAKGLVNVHVPSDPRKPQLQKLDHIFVRGLLVEKARVDSRYVSSDHYPLVAHFAVK
jgi:endonuclease/exonuclease/phosphatase (EEP) superfamily protein YafD